MIIIGNYIGRLNGQNWASSCKPSSLLIAEIAGGIRLIWTDHCGDETGFEIYISVNGGAYYLLDTVAANVETYDDTANHGGYSVQYKVRAFKGIEYSDYSDESLITISDVPYLTCPAGDEYAYVADNGALDFTNTLFTLCGFLKGEGAGGIFQYIVGKGIYGSVNGRYVIYCDTDNKYVAHVQGVANAAIRTSDILCTDGDWHFHCITFDALDNMIYTIDGVTKGTGPNPGAGAALGNQYEFYLGAGSNGTGAGVSSIAKHSFKDICVYKSKMTVAEQTAQMAGTIKAGYLAHYKCAVYPLVDETGNFNLTGVNLDASNIATTPTIP
jgi:hypothetical protein